MGSTIRKVLTSAILTSYRPLSDKSFNLSLNIPEPSKEQRDVIHSLHQQAVFLLIKEGEIEQSEVSDFESLNGAVFNKKSQSKRIHDVFYVLWKQQNEGFEEFKNYYQYQTEKLINHLKAKIV